MQFIFAVALALSVFSAGADAMLARRMVIIRRLGSTKAVTDAPSKKSPVEAIAAGAAVAANHQQTGGELPQLPWITEIVEDVSRTAHEASSAIAAKTFKPKTLTASQPKITEPSSSSSSSGSDSDKN